MKTVEKLTEEGLAAAPLSPLPATTLEIVRVLSDPCFEFSELIRPISRDPDLTAKILRLANSPLYGRSRPASTIGDAVVRLGSGMVQGLALACATRPSTKCDLSGFGLNQSEFWTHCVASVAAAEEIQRTGIVRFGSGFATASAAS